MTPAFPGKPIHVLVVDDSSLVRMYCRGVLEKAGFEVDENFNADPQSGYRRGKRQITLSSGTKFEESARQDLRAGRMVDIIGLETTDPGVQATRVIVYEGNAPVRMPAGARVIAPDGSVRF